MEAADDRQLAIHPGEDLSPAPPHRREGRDRYYTPVRCAVACCEAIRLEGGIDRVASVLEPAVGGGAWTEAARQVWPGAWVTACDTDPEAAGLRTADAALCASFLTSRWVRQGRYELVIGNRPYNGTVQDWVDRALELAPAVAYLERGTILGSLDRCAWWQRRPPASVWVLAPRPRWTGPGALKSSDSVDSVLILWTREATEARLRWLRW